MRPYARALVVSAGLILGGAGIGTITTSPAAVAREPRKRE